MLGFYVIIVFTLSTVCIPSRILKSPHFDKEFIRINN